MVFKHPSPNHHFNSKHMVMALLCPFSRNNRAITTLRAQPEVSVVTPRYSLGQRALSSTLFNLIDFTHILRLCMQFILLALINFNMFYFPSTQE